MVWSRALIAGAQAYGAYSGAKRRASRDSDGVVLKKRYNNPSGRIGSNVPRRYGTYSGSRKLPYRRLSKRTYGAKLKKPCNGWKRPPRKFVKRVEAVLAKDTPCGVWTKLDLIAQPFTGYQVQNTLSSFANSANRFNEFSYASIADAASVMFNGKTAVVAPDLTLTGNFDDNVKIVVENQKTVFNLLNNFGVGITVKIYTCFPKTTQNLEPIALWESAKLEYTQQLNQTTGSNNIAPSDSTFLYDEPTKYHSFNTHYKVNKKTVYLKPGDRYSFVRNGPCRTYDFTASKNQNTDTTYKFNAPGVNQAIFFAYVADLVGVIGGGTMHRASSMTGSQNFTIERVRTACIRAPDETPIANKKQIMSYNNWLANVAVPGVPQAIGKPLAGYNVTI